MSSMRIGADCLNARWRGEGCRGGPSYPAGAPRPAGVRGRIRTQSPRYAALTSRRRSPSPHFNTTCSTMRRSVEYALGEERSFLWAVTTRELASYELPGRATLETAARRVHELLIVSHKR